MLINDLILTIKNTDFFSLRNVLNSYNSYDWENYVVYDENKYCRNKIYSDNTLEIFIIAWLPNQKANIHDHSENGCWLKVLRGRLTEKKFDENLNFIEINYLNDFNNNISFMENKIGFHSIENNSDSYAITLHIYSPPNHKTNFLNISFNK